MMKNFLTVFQGDSGTPIVIFLALICVCFVILRWRYLLRYMKLGVLLMGLAVFLLSLLNGILTLSRSLHVIHP
jgi:cell division protein FtsW (lipid II flippase)